MKKKYRFDIGDLIVVVCVIIVGVNLYNWTLGRHRFIRYRPDQLEPTHFTCGEAILPPSKAGNGWNKVGKPLAKQFSRILWNMKHVEKLDDEHTPLNENDYRGEISFLGPHLVFYPSFFIDNGHCYTCDDYPAVYQKVYSLVRECLL